MVSIAPEAIDSRLVLRAYTWAAIGIGLFVYAWGPMWLPDPHLDDVPWGWAALLRTAGALVVAFGCCAAALAAAADSRTSRRGLIFFALAHAVFGALFLLQWIAILESAVPPVIGWTPLLVGIVLGYLAITGPGRRRRASAALSPIDGGHGFMIRNQPAVGHWQSEYEQHIRQVARQEERARLARDLHDAVKQQLFVIQTAAATAQARFDVDAEGTRTAIDQVRSAAREAMVEMEAMLEQLQAAPLSNDGLIASLKKQCEALGFRTGARIDVEIGALPADSALTLGARQAVLRVAQEALANVARHARAQHVRVMLGLDHGALVLKVVDDGAGFQPAAPGRGMGLANIAARASEVGGDVNVMSTPERGTAVTFAVPCYASDSSHAYVAKAVAWTGVLVLSVSYSVRQGPGDHPWLAALAAVAAIATARHIVAASRVRRWTVAR
jgi:signal transduction histidine kinase